MKTIANPKARTENLVIQQVGDETLVYDLTTNKAHCLNETAGFVWNRCTGDRSINEIANAVEVQFGHAVDADFVRLALKQLENESLLTENGFGSIVMPNRREAIKRIGLASAIVIPIVSSLLAPSRALGSVSCACVSPGDCISQSGCPNPNNCNTNNGLCVP
ncbi:MAG: PqqD family protein [Pyrinomonadaceae bacterium]